MLIRSVEGNSMLPGLVPGTIVVAFRRQPRRGDVVIAHMGTVDVVKRVEKVENGRYYLLGDNRDESVDSREFGAVKKGDILGVVMLKFAVATEPPKPRTPVGAQLGWVVAAVMTGAALIHLFRIDTWLPILDKALPGGELAASLAGALIVIAEVLAIPFLLRMRLSPLMRLKSGFAVALVPLVWLLITLWGLGFNYSTGQFGEFLPVRGSWALIGLNAVWLAFNLWTLWQLGYDQATKNLRKQR